MKDLRRPLDAGATAGAHWTQLTRRRPAAGQPARLPRQAGAAPHDVALPHSPSDWRLKAAGV